MSNEIRLTEIKVNRNTIKNYFEQVLLYIFNHGKLSEKIFLCTLPGVHE